MYKSEINLKREENSEVLLIPMSSSKVGREDQGFLRECSNHSILPTASHILQPWVSILAAYWYHLGELTKLLILQRNLTGLGCNLAISSLDYSKVYMRLTRPPVLQRASSKMVWCTFSHDLLKNPRVSLTSTHSFPNCQSIYDVVFHLREWKGLQVSPWRGDTAGTAFPRWILDVHLASCNRVKWGSQC